MQFAQRSVDYLVRRPIWCVSLMAALCLAMVLWQGMQATNDAHRHAAIDAARDQARAFATLAHLLQDNAAGRRRTRESTVAQPNRSMTPLRTLVALAKRLSRRHQSDWHSSTIRIIATRGGFGLPSAQGPIELKAAALFLRGQRRPFVRVIERQDGQAVLYAIPLMTRGIVRPIRPAATGQQPALVMQVITVPLPGWIDGADTHAQLAAVDSDCRSELRLLHGDLPAPPSQQPAV